MIYGTRATNIGNFIVEGTSCAYCNTESSQRVSVFGKYVHIFWIPIFPIGKKSVSECVHCKRTIEKKEFSPALKKGFVERIYSVKRPFWHYLGLIIIGVFIALITIVGLTHEEDPRSELLKSDTNHFSASPSFESDSTSAKLKTLLDDLVTDEIDPESFQYNTNIKEDRALILIKIPELKHVEKDSRTEILDVVEMFAAEQPELAGKQLYIGVEGAITMMMVKTPTSLSNSRIASQSDLYEFYGPKQKK